MTTLTRIPENPILSPDPLHPWEHDGAFNGCVVFAEGMYHMVYRALSEETQLNGVQLQVSTVGYAKSTDGIHFGEHRLLFGPTEEWELYGCEDPRITYMDGQFYIFYTALSVFPFAAYGIKVAVAKTRDFVTFEKHPVTPFNAKAMGLFPERINGKMVALLTINTDLPPAKIAVAEFETENDIWSPFFWSMWFDAINEHSLHLLRDMRDQVELGAPPIKTEKGWLVIYSYIGNYMSHEKTFGIEAVLLDLENPRNIIGRTSQTLLTPVEQYELTGVVPNVVFPSGALIKDGTLYVYYGAADTRCAVATCDATKLLTALTTESTPSRTTAETNQNHLLQKYKDNPIIQPIPELVWQAAGTFNPTALYTNGTIHLVYRAQSFDGTSVLGYAASTDGTTVAEKIDEPIYVPRETFELKKQGSGNSGCEDPRITAIGDRFYMTYTAYDGVTPPRVALTSIHQNDFLEKRWQWERPILISQPGVDDKNACVISAHPHTGYIAFHRLGDAIWIDFLKDLHFSDNYVLSGSILAHPRQGMWDNVKIGIAGPPITTEAGLLLLYHGVSNPGFAYKLGAMLLDHDDPRKILARSPQPVLVPETQFETIGQVPNVVFSCGAVVIGDMLYVYYGGADKVICVATAGLSAFVRELQQSGRT
jgi:beta-1,2-mannobiose phosphorylase / 1,2-beta-oligomannan phosphorylase